MIASPHNSADMAVNLNMMTTIIAQAAEKQGQLIIGSAGWTDS
jgi:hypothetical protein